MTKQGRKLFGFAGTLLLLLLVGCTEDKVTKAQDENIQTIEAVLQNSLSGPSDELKEILNKKSGEKVEAFDQYEEKQFRDYFADETSYAEFVNNYGSILMIPSNGDAYQFKINHIDYEKVDAKDHVYDFSVELQLQNENSGESLVENVTGQANLNDEHKLETMLIRTEDLYQSIHGE